MSIIDNAKEIALVVKKFNDVELYRKIVDLQGEIVSVVGENRELHEEVDRLRESLKLKQDLVFEHNAYWLPGQGGRRDGPFCSNCWDGDQTLRRMHDYGVPNYARCPKCKDNVNITGVPNVPSSVLPHRSM